MDEDSSIVRFEDVSLCFENTRALDHVSFRIAAGETLVVFGAAGSGKTVMLKAAVGLLRADSGRIYLFGRDITRMRERQLFDMRARVGILFQEGGLFDSMTIGENVAYPLLNQPSLRVPAQPDGSRPIEDRVRESLRFVELEGTVDKYPSELSGGMRRRVGIARAVVTEPALLLYDSPTAGLDPITANTIIALILKERDMRNAATIMVSHRYQDGQWLANFRYNPNSGKIEPAKDGEGGVKTRFLVMREGRVVFEGSEKEMLASPDSYVKKFTRPGAS
jgi:phospholipid/cholesterol/gamma-HCH transport system ATP-binding protein